MTGDANPPVISVMLAVTDATASARWYARALGATELWNLGGVVGLNIAGAPFFLGQPENNGWDTPPALGSRTVRVEVFVDDPDAFIERAVTAGADGSGDEIRDHQAPWGVHRQGGFIDPYGHLWLVGDRSPLNSGSALSLAFGQNGVHLRPRRDADRPSGPGQVVFLFVS